MIDRRVSGLFFHISWCEFYYLAHWLKIKFTSFFTKMAFILTYACISIIYHHISINNHVSSSYIICFQSRFMARFFSINATVELSSTWMVHLFSACMIISLLIWIQQLLFSSPRLATSSLWKTFLKKLPKKNPYV